MIDSGASAHFTTHLEDFSEIKMGNFGEVQTASKIEPMLGRGNVLIEHLVVDKKTGVEHVRKTRLWPVFYFKGRSDLRLISPGQLLRSGLRLEADAETSNFFDEKGQIVLQGISGFFPMIHSIPSRVMKMPKNQVTVLTPSDYSSWHQCLGHPSDIVLNRFFEETQGVPRILIPKKKPICDGCVKGKLTQKSFPQSESQATRVLQLVHSDLFKLPVLSYHCFKWVMTVLDDFSSTAYLVMLSSKSEAANQLINVINFLSNLLGQKCLKLRTDQGGEYVNQKLKDFVATSSIQHELTSPNVHQQNGQAERLNRMLHEKSQAIRMQACLPENWWEFSMQYAVFLYNRTPMQ
jgi:hypothetical protein